MKIFANHSQRVEAFKQITIYPVVSPEFCNGRDVEFVVEQLGKGGAKIVQLRLKNATTLEYLNLAKKCREITHKYGMLLIIDDRVDVALASDADGVHLGQDDMPISQARKIAPELLLGCSTHNRQEIENALRDDTSYLNIGPIYPTKTKSVACGALGLEIFCQLKDLVSCPFSVMGGIKQHHIPELVKLGAKHIAMVTEITQAENIAEKVSELIKCFEC